MAEEPKLGSVVHIELPCKDVERAKKFYGDIFDWKFEDYPDMNYTTFEAPSGPGGGLFVPEEFNPGGTLNYLLVDSVEEASSKIEAGGGKILVPKSEVPGMGWFAIFQDPEGTKMALWKGSPQSEE